MQEIEEKKMYDFNMLISCPWSQYANAKKEIQCILKRLGEEKPLVTRTIAKGIIGVKTSQNPSDLIHAIQRMHIEDPTILQYTSRWVPIQLWTYSDIDSMKKTVERLKIEIQTGEKWRITLEKRRFTKYHKIEIISNIAELIDGKVDLKNPDKILHIDIIGKYAGISVLRPDDIFSISHVFRIS
jgi:tRNA(Ser,Leu) C12 N-acetylase TAN1